MEGTSSMPSAPLLDNADKAIVTNVRRRIQTAVDAQAACDDPAAGLLDLSRKCAAMYAGLDSSAKRCPVAVRRLRSILSPLATTLKIVKGVVRNSKEWVTQRVQQEVFELMGLHLEGCLQSLRSIKTERNADSFWPELKTTNNLEKKTAVFTAKCDRRRVLTLSKRTQPADNKKTSPDSSPPSKRSDSRSACSTVAPSDDDATDKSPLSSSSSSSLLSLCSATFAGSENITVRPSSLLKWGKVEDGSTETSPPSPSPSVRVAERQGLRRQKGHRPVKVSVSPGAAFVPYRSPARLAGARGTSLRGSGAIAARKSRIW